MMETITLAGGCFWCTEAIFSQLKGVEKSIPGYSGGKTNNPTYEEVSSGNSGHAEVAQITFNPEIIPLKDLLYVFFKLHDPTTLNKQGADEGTQYRSAIFFESGSQKETAQEVIRNIQNDYKNPIVTKVAKFKNFFPAEEYHKEYYFKNRNMPYCRLVIDPKIQKLKNEFAQILR